METYSVVRKGKKLDRNRAMETTQTSLVELAFLQMPLAILNILLNIARSFSLLFLLQFFDQQIEKKTLKPQSKLNQIKLLRLFFRYWIEKV